MTLEVVWAAMSWCRQGSMLAWQRACGWVHDSWDDRLEPWGGQVSGEASAHSSGLWLQWGECPQAPWGHSREPRASPSTRLPSTASLRTMRLAPSLRTLSEDSARSHTCACPPRPHPTPPPPRPKPHHPGTLGIRVTDLGDSFSSSSPSTRSLANNNLETLPRFLFRGLETLTHV